MSNYTQLSKNDQFCRSQGVIIIRMRDLQVMLTVGTGNSFANLAVYYFDRKSSSLVELL